MVRREVNDEDIVTGDREFYKIPGVRENTWLLLVTNAEIKVLAETANLESLLSFNANQDNSELFTHAPWVTFQPEKPLSLVHHQQRSVEPLVDSSRDKYDRSTPELMSNSAHQVHIVHYEKLGDFLRLVADPPRVEQIGISLSVDGGEPTEFTIK